MGEMDQSALSPAQWLAAQRRRVVGKCEVCGTPMPDSTVRRRYCGNACSQRAKYQRLHKRQAAAGEQAPEALPR